MGKRRPHRVKLRGSSVDGEVVKVGFERSELAKLAGRGTDEDGGISAPSKSGVLLKYTNRVRGWKKRYFRLDNGVLSYFSLDTDGNTEGVENPSHRKGKKKGDLGANKHKGRLKRFLRKGSGGSASSILGLEEKHRVPGTRRGEINVQFAVVSPDDSDVNKFVIDVGSSILHCKADSGRERDSWVNALKDSIRYFEDLVKRATERATTSGSSGAALIPKRREKNVTEFAGPQESTHSTSTVISVEDDCLQDAVRSKDALIAELRRVDKLMRKKLYASTNEASDESSVASSAVIPRKSRDDRCSCFCAACSSEEAALLESLCEAFPDVPPAKGLSDLIAWCLHTLNTDEQVFMRVLKRAASSSSHRPSSSSPRAGLQDVPAQPLLETETPDESDDEFFDARTRLYTSTSSLMDIALDVAGPSGNGDVIENEIAESSAVSTDDAGSDKSECSNELHLRTRTELPRLDGKIPTVSVWSVVKDSIGKDLSRIAIPVALNEPLSFVQRLAEDIEYCEILDTAAAASTSTERLMHVAAFVVSHYSSTRSRPNKPFNSLLGQTFDLHLPDKGESGGIRFISEQVSHHPPVSACYAEGGPCSETSGEPGLRWRYWNSIEVKNKFWGKSIEVFPTGWNQVELPRTNDLFRFEQVTSCVHNIVVGRMWLDNYGEMEIVNERNGDTAKLKFHKTGWMSDASNYGAVKGVVQNRSGVIKHRIRGNWTEALYEDLPSGRRRLLWQAKERPGKAASNGYNMTSWAISLNRKIPKSHLKYIIPTDSRLRPDQRALENGHVEEAQRLKFALEEAQRNRGRKLEAAGIKYKPQWFEWVKDPKTGTYDWRYNGTYFKRKRACDWSGCPRIFDLADSRELAN